MTKRICDRCGKVCGENFAIIAVKHFRGDRYCETAERDLCETCTNLLGEFIDGNYIEVKNPFEKNEYGTPIPLVMGNEEAKND